MTLKYIEFTSFLILYDEMMLSNYYICIYKVIPKCRSKIKCVRIFSLYEGSTYHFIKFFFS